MSQSLAIKSLYAQVEGIWLEPLRDHIKTLFLNAHLPSHDLDHHIRVWAYCKDMMFELANAGFAIDEKLVTQALISCLFHDTGLTIDTGEQHGCLGRILCEQYFKENDSLYVEGIEEILEAIALHDNKSFRYLNSPIPNSLQNIVSTADDLDALGYIGVFRYIEIYTHRGITIDQLPRRVLCNLEGRFKKFEQTYGMLTKCVDEQRIRANAALNFFRVMHQQTSVDNGITMDSLAVATLLVENLIVQKRGINEAIENVLGAKQREGVYAFFTSLRDELRVSI